MAINVISVGILTVSDRCSRGETQDSSGDNLALAITSVFPVGENVTVTRKCVPDDKEDIRAALLAWSDRDKMNLVLTTGGTGVAPRDVTPEATASVLERPAPAIVHSMTSGSLTVTPLAMLSRATAGIRGRTLIVNLPGSKKASAECLQFVAPALPHAVQLLMEQLGPVAKTHHDLQHRCHHHNQKRHEKSVVDVSNVAGRARESPYPMISVQQAQEIVLSHCDSATETEVIPFGEALGRVLAQDVFAQDPLPPFPASIKDGYAVIWADGAGLRPVTGGSNAGSLPSGSVLQPGQCMRINTGAPVPLGADAVVQVEDTELVSASSDGKEELEIRILVAPVHMQDIRPVGSDIAKGSLVLERRSHLGPAELGLLATVGATQVEVFKRPTVGLLSTGNELQDPNEVVLRPGAIRDSNKTTLIALMRENSIPYKDCGIAKDEPGNLLWKLREALSSCDVLVSTGGVSMGDRDILRQVLTQDLGATIHFARVHMKPGKPTTFATLDFAGRRKLVLGLPGNPVSAFVTSHLYVLPVCRRLAGHASPLPALVRAVLSTSTELDPRPEFQRAILFWQRGSPVAQTLATGNQISSRLISCSAANGLIMLPARSEVRRKLEADTEVDAMVIGDLRREFV